MSITQKIKSGISVSKKHRKKIFRWLGGIVAAFSLVMLILYLVIRSHTAEIQAAVHQTLADQVNGTVTTGDIHITMLSHFPHFSVVVNDIEIQDNHSLESKQPLLKAKKIYLQIRVFELFRKQVRIRAISIDDASILIFRQADGIFNTSDIIKPSTDTTKAPLDEMLISRLYLENVHVVFSDNRYGKNYDLLFNDSSIKLHNGTYISDITTKDNIYSKGLTFHPERGTCLSNKIVHTKFNLEWDRAEQYFTIDPSAVEVDKNKFTVQGSVNKLTGGDRDTYIKILVSSKSVVMQNALTLVSSYTRTELKGYDFKRPLPLSLSLEGAYDPENALPLDINFSTENNTFTSSTKTFENVSLKGHYNNHLYDISLNNKRNQALALTEFTGTYEGIPFNMNLDVADLDTPVIDMHLHCFFPLTDANTAVDTSSIIFTTGTLLLDAEFKGRLGGYTPENKDSIDAVMSGTALIQDAGCRFPDKKYDLKNIEGTLLFNEKNMYVSSLSFDINNNQVKMKAAVSQFVNALIFPDEKLEAVASLSCDHFVLDDFARPEKSHITSAGRQKIAGVVSSIMENLTGNLTIHCDKVTYKKAAIENVNGKLTLGNNFIACKGISMQSAKGNFTLDGNISGIGGEGASVHFSSTISKADIRELFYEFDNFYQSSISSDNLRGLVSAKATFAASLNSHFSIIPSSMSGTLAIDVEKGALLNMGSLQQLSGNLFKKKDLSDIEFAELIDSSTLIGTSFHIQQMEIQSSLFTMYVNGIYSFGDSTELYIRVPLKSLQEKDNYIEANKSEDAKIGMSFNFRATKREGKLKIMPMLFRKK